MPHYEESMSAPVWLLGSVVLAGAAMLGGAAVLIADDAVSDLAGTILAVVLIASALAMILVARTFATLRITVDDRTLQFGFGPIRKSLGAAEIVGAAPDRYPWVRYGGWGVRASTGKHRAYSQAFARESVVIHAADQHRYHVTSRRPAELADAINQLAAAESASL
jgi:hypothetical protein